MVLLTFKELRRGTFSRSDSYIFRFWKAFLNTILRNVCLSMAQSIPSPADWMVAALGMLYINASSPKLPLFSQHPTLTSWFPCLIKMLYTPLKFEKAILHLVWCIENKMSSYVCNSRKKHTFLQHRNYLHHLLVLLYIHLVSLFFQTWHLIPHLIAQILVNEITKFLSQPQANSSVGYPT